MIDTYKIYEELKEDISDSAARKIAFIIGSLHDEFQHLVVTREELKELKEAVNELILAHKSAEQRLTKLETAVAELAEAQKKAEERLTRLEVTVQELIEAQKRTEQRVNELAEAQKKAEERLTRLEITVQELAEAQKKTEQRLNELAEAQKKAEERLTRLETAVAELAEAQKRTEEELRILIGEHKKTREQLGGLSHTVGYILEDRAYRGLPELLKRDFGVQTISLKRDFIEIAPKKYEEVNILGEAQKDGKRVWIIGDCKTQLKKKDIDEFLELVKKIDKSVKGEKILLSVTYQTSPPVRAYAQEKGVKIYFSYEMPL
jgi:chromosome segregation ATPase